MSTEQIYQAVARAAAPWFEAREGRSASHLDIGAGEGALIGRLGARFDCRSTACDYHSERFARAGVPIVRVDVDRAGLPFADRSFDLVTCSEVIEHPENFRALLREAHQVLRPGGLLVLTTPNVLNARSRVRFLASGFASLFGPLPVRHDEKHSTAGRISPVPYFYLAHALLEVGFEYIELSFDKVQRTSLAWATLLAPLLATGWLRFRWREAHRYRTLTSGNAAHVD